MPINLLQDETVDKNKAAQPINKAAQPINLLPDYVKENNEKNPFTFGDFIKNKFKQFGEEKPLAETYPQLKEIPIGMKEGFRGSLSAIPGLKEYLPDILKERPPVPVSPYEQSGAMRTTGKMLGEIPVMGAIGAPIAAAGTAVGVPATIAGLGGSAVAGGLTTPGETFNRLMGAASTMVPYGAGKVASKIPGIFKILTSKVTPRDLVKVIQGKHDIAEKEATDLFDYVKNQVKPRNIQYVDIPDEVFDEAASVLPKTRANEKLLKAARKGDYDELHDLQSDLGKRGRKNLESDLASEQKQGEEILDLRNRINEYVEENFRKLGHDDLADTLLEARKKWANLKDLYYSHPATGRMVSEETRKVPKNPLSVFTEESKQMEKIHKAHPELPDLIKLLQEKKNITKKLGLGAGLTIPGAAGYIGGLMTGKNPEKTRDIYEAIQQSSESQ